MNSQLTGAHGIRSNIEIDMFGFKVLDLNKPYTMRGLLSTTASVFDPSNFPAPGDVVGQTDNASSVVLNPMGPINQWGDFDEMGEMEEQSFFLFFLEEQSASLEGNKCSSLLFESSLH